MSNSSKLTQKDQVAIIDNFRHGLNEQSVSSNAMDLKTIFYLTSSTGLLFFLTQNIFQRQQYYSECHELIISACYLLFIGLTVYIFWKGSKTIRGREFENGTVLLEDLEEFGFKYELLIKQVEGHYRNNKVTLKEKSKYFRQTENCMPYELILGIIMIIII